MKAVATAPVIDVEETTEVEGQVSALVERAEALVIEDDESFEGAAIYLRDLKGMEKEVHRIFDPLCQAAHASHKAVTSQRGELLRPITAAEKATKAAISDYALRKEQEQQQAIEEGRAAAQAQQEEEHLERAAELENEGRVDEAEAEMAKAERPALMSVPDAAPPAAEGVSTRKQHDFVVVDVEKIDRRFMVPDEKKIRTLVRSLGLPAAEMVGGIEVTTKTIVSARAN